MPTPKLSLISTSTAYSAHLLNSMSSTTPEARRILSDLDPNTSPAQIAPPVSSPPTSPFQEKARSSGKSSLASCYTRTAPPIHADVGRVGQKRHIDVTLLAGSESLHSPKRCKTDTGSSPRCRDTAHELHSSLLHSVDGEIFGHTHEASGSTPVPGETRVSHLSSPFSCTPCNIEDVNDSQNMILTEPDMAPRQNLRSLSASRAPASTKMSATEVREKAALLKLRLGLASYKVRTNQVNVPLNRLQLRTSVSSSSLRLPTLPDLPCLSGGRQCSRTLLPKTTDAQLTPSHVADGKMCSSPSLHIPSSPPTLFPLHTCAVPAEYRPASTDPQPHISQSHLSFDPNIDVDVDVVCLASVAPVTAPPIVLS